MNKPIFWGVEPKVKMGQEIGKPEQWYPKGFILPCHCTFHNSEIHHPAHSFNLECTYNGALSVSLLPLCYANCGIYSLTQTHPAQAHKPTPPQELLSLLELRLLISGSCFPLPFQMSEMLMDLMYLFSLGSPFCWIGNVLYNYMVLTYTADMQADPLHKTPSLT